MAIVTREQLIKKIRDIANHENSDSYINVLEDLTDTLNDYEDKTKDSEDWKKKYEENDKEWRDKYTKRFYEPETSSNVTVDLPQANDIQDDKGEKVIKNYEDLFTTV